MRNYGRFTTSIYRDDDFKALTLAQQGAYYMLGLQGEVSAAGLLSLTLRRWARLAKGETPDSLAGQLAELEKMGHILIDDDTEELLIVKFVKWDNGYSNSKRLPVIREAALSIESPILRSALAAEMRDLGLVDMASELDPDTPSDRPPDTASPQGADTPSDSPSDAITPSDRVVVTSGEYIPHPSTHKPQPPGRRPADAASESHTGAAAAAIRAYVGACIVPPAAALQDKVDRSARALLAEGHPAEAVIAAAASAGRAGWTDLGVQMQRDAASTRPAAEGGRTSTTDQRVRAGRDLAAQLRADEQKEIGA